MKGAGVLVAGLLLAVAIFAAGFMASEANSQAEALRVHALVLEARAEVARVREFCARNRL